MKSVKSVKHVNPYRSGSQYNKAFALMQKKQVVTRSQLVKFLMDGGLVSKGKGQDGSEAAIATATVLLSPREVDGRGDRRGNLSAKGEVYFVQPLKHVKGEEKKFRLRWRVKELAQRDYERPSTIATKKEVVQEKHATKPSVAPVAPAVEA